MKRSKKQSTEAAVREIRRKTRRKFAPEEKIRIVVEGLRGEQSISELCRREGIASSLYYRWTKGILEVAPGSDDFPAIPGLFTLWVLSDVEKIGLELPTPLVIGSGKRKSRIRAGF